MRKAYGFSLKYPKFPTHGMENPPPEPVGFRPAEETGPSRAGRGDPYMYVVLICT